MESTLFNTKSKNSHQSTGKVDALKTLSRDTKKDEKTFNDEMSSEEIAEIVSEKLMALIRNHFKTAQQK